MSPTVFDQHGQDKLIAWRQFRDAIEISQTPFEDVSNLWSYAPFVNPYLDYQNPHTWPDPWQLVLDSRLDDLAIVLGMLYTIKLTQRFKDTPCEMFRINSSADNEYRYILVVDNQNVLNFEYNRVVGVNKLVGHQPNLIWSSPQLW